MNEKVTALLEKYQEELAVMLIPADRVEDQVGFPGVKGLKDDADQLGHLQWMIFTMLDEGKDWDEKKVNRWLGFIQGVLWTTKLRGILQLRDESRNLYE